MNDKIIIKNLNTMNAKHIQKYEYDFNKYEVTQRKDFSQAYICFYEIMPGKTAFPKHYHSYNTECFYILNGHGIIETDDSSFDVKSGDIIVFPCGKNGTHKLINSSQKETLLYIDFDTTNSPDIIHYVDSHKTGIIEHNISSTFFRDEDNVDYYDNEE